MSEGGEMLRKGKATDDGAIELNGDRRTKGIQITGTQEFQVSLDIPSVTLTVKSETYNFPTRRPATAKQGSNKWHKDNR